MRQLLVSDNASLLMLLCYLRVTSISNSSARNPCRRRSATRLFLPIPFKLLGVIKRHVYDAWTRAQTALCVFENFVAPRAPQIKNNLILCSVSLI